MKRKALAALLFACALISHGALAQTNRGQALSSATGRFVFGQISESGKDKYMLDTQTGRLWEVISYCEDMSKRETCQAAVLRPVLYESIGRTVTSQAPIPEPPAPQPRAQK
jgi:hypothetical protein